VVVVGVVVVVGIVVVAVVVRPLVVVGVVPGCLCFLGGPPVVVGDDAPWVAVSCPCVPTEPVERTVSGADVPACVTAQASTAPAAARNTTAPATTAAEGRLLRPLVGAGGAGGASTYVA
jgi:hypothetical protein